MYIPGLITISYLYNSNPCELPCDKHSAINIFINILIAECLYASTTIVKPYTNFNIKNIILFLILQDIWFYTFHKLFHSIPILYRIHKLHHSKFGPFFTWYIDWREHVLINIGSFTIPWLLFPNNPIVLVSLIIIQIYSAVDGHKEKSQHEIHHLFNNRRYGSIYLLDRIFGTY